jgi:hypothetical protein
VTNLKSYQGWDASWGKPSVNTSGIVIAEDASGAKNTTFRSISEANYETMFTNIRVRRAPKFDLIAEEKWRGKAFSIEYANHLLKDKK